MKGDTIIEINHPELSSTPQHFKMDTLYGKATPWFNETTFSTSYCCILCGIHPFYHMMIIMMYRSAQYRQDKVLLLLLTDWYPNISGT